MTVVTEIATQKGLARRLHFFSFTTMADDDDSDGEAPSRPGLKTRRANRAAHPGLVAMEKLKVGSAPRVPAAKRRTKAQIIADKAAEEVAKAVADALQEERVAAVARLENEMEERRIAVAVTLSVFSSFRLLKIFLSLAEGAR